MSPLSILIIIIIRGQFSFYIKEDTERGERVGMNYSPPPGGLTRGLSKKISELFKL